MDRDIGQLNGLTVDDGFHNHDGIARIYWTDGLLKRIESIHLDGTQRKIIIGSGLTLPFSVTILGDFIYWSDNYHNVVERANRWTGFDYQLITDNVKNIKQIKSVSSERQTLTFQDQNGLNVPHSNPCAWQNGACSHLCLFRPHGYICACPLIIEKPCSTSKFCCLKIYF